MSFILDALKKSQASRQQQAGPGTIAVETAPRPQQQHNWWAAVIAIVLINLTALVGLIYWNSRDRQPEPARELTQSVGSQGGTEADRRAESLRPATDTAAARMPAERGEVSPLSAEVKQPRVVTPSVPAPTVRPAEPSPPPTASADAPANTGESDYLPTLAELQLENRIALSPMHVDVHVYNENPQRRFVLVNTRKYKEGERMTEGPLLEAIRRDGIVLYYRGQRFLLPRD